MIKGNYGTHSIRYDVTISWALVGTYFALLSISISVLAENIHLFLLKLFIEKLLGVGYIAVFLRIYFSWERKYYAINYTFSNESCISAVKSRYWELRSHSHTTKVLYLGKSGNVSHERQLLSYL